MKPLKKTSRIAILGAGATGLTAALELKKKGYTKVTVFEKESRVGGKSFSFAYKGKVFDMGSMTFAKTDATGILARELGIPYQTVHVKDLYLTRTACLNPLTHIRQNCSSFELLLAYIRFRSQVRMFNIDQPGYSYLNPELYQSFDQYIRKHRIEALANAVQPAITGYGYGYYEDIPAAYGMKLMAAMLDHTFIRSLLTGQSIMCFFPGGWTSLWEKAAEPLQVRSNTEIDSIVRQEEGIQLSIQGKTEIFDALIIATPLQELHRFMDLTSAEKALFAQIRCQRMISTLVETSNSLPTGFLLHNVTPNRLGHVLGIENYYPETHTAVLFQTVPKTMSKTEIDQHILEDLRELGSQKTSIVFQKDWDYFFHVSSEDISQGFYAKVDAMQAEQGVYYFSSVLNFEAVSRCQDFATMMVKKYF